MPDSTMRGTDQPSCSASALMIHICDGFPMPAKVLAALRNEDPIVTTLGPGLARLGPR
jgi:hypothetical protein